MKRLVSEVNCFEWDILKKKKKKNGTLNSTRSLTQVSEMIEKKLCQFIEESVFLVAVHREHGSPSTKQPSRDCRRNAHCSRMSGFLLVFKTFALNYYYRNHARGTQTHMHM